MKNYSKLHGCFNFLLLMSALWLSGCATYNKQEQAVPQTFAPGKTYDAREFLPKTEIGLFNRLFPDFEKAPFGKNWEWKDVDPLAILSPSENRKRRREIFLYEYSSSTLPANEKDANDEQLAFVSILKKRFPEAQILMKAKTVKIISRYEPSYEDLPTLRNPEKPLPAPKSILELTASLGLQWSSFGGVSLFIYNGPILMSKFQSGYVSLALPNIDRPLAN